MECEASWGVMILFDLILDVSMNDDISDITMNVVLFFLLFVRSFVFFSLSQFYILSTIIESDTDKSEEGNSKKATSESKIHSF